jgi:morphogenetic protein associated with SpoVID
VFEANRRLPDDPNVEWPKRDPAKDELPKVDPLKFEPLKFEPLKFDPPKLEPLKREPLKPAPPRAGPDREAHCVPERASDDALRDGPNECQAPSDLPPL